MRKAYLAFINSLFLLAILGVFISCDFFSYEVTTVMMGDHTNQNSEINVPEIKHRIWSILVYMAADNDLEAAAIEDIYEMEVSNLDTNEVSVFVLLDRSNSYDTSNYDWTGAKLYKLKTGRSRECKTIISEEIPCESLGLYKDKHTELDMSSNYTLSNALDYIKKQYPADFLGFIMWGHGTGWRCAKNEELYTKGFAYDNSTNSYMTLKQLGDGLERALNDDKLDFLGLDTCFGGEIEVMYELRNRTKYAVGTEGLLLLSGWNYESIFNSLQREYKKTPRQLCYVCTNAFEREYELATSASITSVDMSKMDNYFHSFDLVMKEIASNITTKNIRDNLFNSLYTTSNCKTKSYSYGKKNSDVYLDINSVIYTSLINLPNNIELSKYVEDFKTISSQCLFSKWSSDMIDGGLGIYFGTLTSGNLIGKGHDKAYIRNNTMEQIQFVSDSNGYVPGQVNKDSFIDKLFYCDY